ncbi:hypothetical protein JCM10212_004144 [Sporobolomyces blumeae]
MWTASVRPATRRSAVVRRPCSTGSIVPPSPPPSSTVRPTRASPPPPPPPPPCYSEIHRFFSSLAPVRREPVQPYEAVEGGPRRRAEAGMASRFGSIARVQPPAPRNVLVARRTYATSSTNEEGSSQGPSKQDPAPSDKVDRRGSGHSLMNPVSHPVSKPYPHYLASLPSSLRRVAASLPSVAGEGRPPTRDQLLSLTTSFFDRLKIRFKWATIRSYRRFRADDWSAFFSVGILGTLGWFLLKTTSAFAVVFFVVNSLSSQEWLAKKLGNYLTESTGVKVVFESAIVPKWGLFNKSEGDSASTGSKIVFKNVYISRGPVKGELGVLADRSTAKEVALVDPSSRARSDDDIVSDDEAKLREMVSQWTHFHLSIDTVEVTLSLRRWLDGKGLVKAAAVRGVRGVVERSHIKYDPDAPTDRFKYRNVPRPGDFCLENLQIQDFLVTIYQPDDFRPYTFSIFSAEIGRLRKQWLFYDLMRAESITGQIDNCLFSLHRPQSIGRTSEEDLKDARWSRMSRFRIDGVPIDHMQSASDTGVMSWVTSGRLDLVADIRFPREADEFDLSAVVADLVDDLTDRLRESGAGAGIGLGSGSEGERIPGRGSLSRDALKAPKRGDGEVSDKEREERRKAVRFAKAVERSDADDDELGGGDGQFVARDREDDEDEDKIVSIDLDLRFKDLKAHVPYFTSNLSYVNNALIRPIVAFINRNRTLIPIHCHLDLGLSEFNGSWTTYDVGILERMSEQVYDALAHHVQTQNDQRIQTVGLWTLQMTANAVLSAFQKNLASLG